MTADVAMQVDGADAQKRKLEGDAEADAKRVANINATSMSIETGLMKNEDFNRDLLRIYYDRLFPIQQMFRWLSYGNNPKSSNARVQKDFFLRREFTFVLEGDIFCRYTCFKDAEEWKSAINQRQPIRMEIGAVYSHPPKNHNTVVAGAYKPIERELVFDIDMDDYDEIRTCCKGAKLCTKCWSFMSIAMKVLKRALTNDFGFKHMFFVYSGRRGMHCWVCDKTARQLSNEHRGAVADYLSLVAGGMGKSRADVKMSGDDLHPFVQETYEICEKYFRDDPNGVLQGQDLLRNGPHLANILNSMTMTEQETISKFMQEHPQASSLQIWRQLEQLGEGKAKLAITGSFKQKQESKLFLKDVVLQYTCPRLDINVSKQMNHLLKAPFVVHPKTGRVCVPIDPDKMDSFDPAKVPTIGKLVDELNAGADVRQTSLREYTHWFEERFLQPMEQESAEELSRGTLDW